MSDLKKGFENVQLLGDDNCGVTTNLVKEVSSKQLFVVKTVSKSSTTYSDPKSSDYLPPVSVADKQTFVEYGKINSPYLIKCVDSYTNESKKSFNYIVEYCAIGNIFSLLSDKFRNKSQIPSTQIKSILAQLSVALYTLHTKNIKHGNIKIDNIYSLNNEGDKIKVGGFGTVNSTYNGLPPEIRLSQPYSLKTDVYSLGFVLQQLLSSQAVVRSFGVINRNDISEGLKSLVAKMLSENPSSRPTISEIVQNADVKDAILTLLPKDSLPAELLAEYHMGTNVPEIKTPPPAEVVAFPSAVAKAPISTPAAATVKPASSPAKPAATTPVRPPDPTIVKGVVSSPAKTPPAFAKAPAAAPKSVAVPSGKTPLEYFNTMTDSEFNTIFGMSRATFNQQPKWKQTNAQKEKGLF